MNVFRSLALGLTALLGVSQAAVAQEKFELTFSTYLPPSYEYVWKPVENFVKTVEEKSGGRVKIKVFHSGQLFGGYEELQALSRGNIDITNMTGTYPSGTVPALGVFILPFLFEDVGHLQRALKAGLLDLGVAQELRDKHDVVVLGVSAFDPYVFYSRRAPITGPKDFKGKIWATTGAADARAIQLLGGSPTSMASSDLYLSFDRGVIDGTPRPLLTGIGRSLYEVVKHVSLVNFALDTSILAINRKTWDRLPKDLQTIITEAAAKRDEEQFDRVKAYITEAIAKYEERGVKVQRLDAAAVAELRQATKPAVDEWVQTVPDGQKYLDVIKQTKGQ
ncbi:TRAP transporter substrate-binding protein DctP [Microvirga massiliensis]|uniref:TRAP transporter substrate-binding protein DctP n=1 Tax=Microvirga massiliensis TaxID=1033741 RepID=UPI00062BEBE5|nr:TRAP transporter substrate-binding protein DctP [Microvirga massiliensis]